MKIKNLLLICVSALTLAVPCANAQPAPARNVTHGTLVSDQTKNYITDTAKPGRRYLRLDAYDLCYAATIRALAPGAPLAGWHAATTTQANDFIAAALSPQTLTCTIGPSSPAGVAAQCGPIPNWIQGDFGDSYAFSSGGNEYDLFAYESTGVVDSTYPLRTLGFVTLGSFTNNYVRNAPALRCPTAVGSGCNNGALDIYKRAAGTNGINLLLYRDDGGAATVLNVGSEWCPASFPDAVAPLVSALDVTPNPVQIGTGTVLMAMVDDSTTGNSKITSAGYNIDGGVLFVPMAADDATFDTFREVVTATLPGFQEAGVYEVCVRGKDEPGNTSNPTDDSNACTLVVAYDPSGGFVTGGGWIFSEAGACQYDAVCAEASGKANFGFVSRYKKGATIPTGNTEFRFSAGGLNFLSETYEWLVVNMNGTNAQYKGSGTINGNLGPAGEAYKFMLWAKDFGNAGTDTFRIKIWYVDAGMDVVVYDNGLDQEIGGGNIVVHTK